MSIGRQKDPTRFFSVVGAGLPPQRRGEGDGRPVPEPHADGELMVSWIVLLAMLAGVSIFAGELLFLSKPGLVTEVLASVLE